MTRIGFIGAAVSGSPADVSEGHITLFVGGADEAVATVHPMLEVYGDPVLHVGSVGAGQAVKLINNALFAAHLQLAHDAMRIARELGVNGPTAANAITCGSGSSIAVAAVKAGDGVFDFLRPFLDKDVDVLRQAAEEMALDLGLLDDTNRAGAMSFGH